jgi:hypothetical protein
MPNFQLIISKTSQINKNATRDLWLFGYFVFLHSSVLSLETLGSMGVNLHHNMTKILCDTVSVNQYKTESNLVICISVFHRSTLKFRNGSKL